MSKRINLLMQLSQKGMVLKTSNDFEIEAALNDLLENNETECNHDIAQENNSKATETSLVATDTKNASQIKNEIGIIFTGESEPVNYLNNGCELDEDNTQDNIETGTSFTDTENALLIENEIEMLITKDVAAVNDVDSECRLDYDITQTDKTGSDFTDTKNSLQMENEIEIIFTGESKPVNDMNNGCELHLDNTQENIETGTNFTDTENVLPMENEIEIIFTGESEPVNDKNYNGCELYYDITQTDKTGSDFIDTKNASKMENEIEIILTGESEPVNDMNNGCKLYEDNTQVNLETRTDLADTSSLFDKEEGMTDAQSQPVEPSNHDSSDYEPTESMECSSSDEDNFRSGRELRRWKSSNKEKWKKNREKLKRRSGEEYRTKTGLKAGKSPKDVNCNSCRWNCSAMFDSETRKRICSTFWKLDYCRQKDFIINLVTNSSTMTKRVCTESGKGKSNSRVYHFKNNEGDKVRVCKAFFLRTLSISHGPVEKALAGVDSTGVFSESDKRGRKVPVNKTDAAVLQRVRDHIDSFPTVESHYCRSSTKRQYLDCNLSIRKMYELYLEEAKSKEKATNVKEPVVTEITYRRVFGQDYNLSFFQPKKDQCIICENMKKSDKTDEMVVQFEKHKKRKEEAYEAKEKDQLRAKNDNSFICATFDMQSVLQLPYSAASQMYYCRKICIYNFTLYESAPSKKGFCFFWSELNGQRGSCEIGTALLNWILQIPNNVSEITLYSDTCSGQNRNQYVAALFLYVVQNTHLQTVDHKFMEKGHSYMECDSMHSAIEKAKRHVSVFSLRDWINIFLTARSCRGKNKKSGSYIVKQLEFSDFINFKSIASKLVKNRSMDTAGEKVNWLKIKALRYEKENPGIIKFKYSHEDNEFRAIKAYGRGRPAAISDLPRLYKKLLPISEAKKKDLVRLCSTDVIPQEYHNWYKSLPTDSKRKDCVPEPGINCSDDSDVESE